MNFELKQILAKVLVFLISAKIGLVSWGACLFCLLAYWFLWIIQCQIKFCMFDFMCIDKLVEMIFINFMCIKKLDMQNTTGRSKDELISKVFQWTLTHGRDSVGRPARTYLHQLCVDTVCSLEDLPGAMDDREEWMERIKDIRAISVDW